MATLAERRIDRAARRLCRECAAGLQETDGSRCLECAELHRKAVGRYHRSKKGRETHAAFQLAAYRSDPVAARVARMARYLAKKLSGECHHCGSAALDGSSFCSTHRARVLKQNRKHNRRKRRAAVVASGIGVSK